MNRAIEFLTEAQKPHYSGWRARQFVKLAVTEVNELLQENADLRRQLAALEARPTDSTAAGARDAALIAMLYSCGLRRAEIVALDLADYNPTTGALTVKGKRNKERLAHVVNGSRLALADWLAIRGNDAGPLFLAINKGGALRQGERLTTQAIYNVVQKRAAEAGIESVSCHDFRRTFVGDLLEAGADIATVQRLAGHASVNTTARYDRRPEEAKRKAAELLHIPYTRRA